MFKKLPLALLVGLSLNSFSVSATDDENEVSSFGELILDKAKDKFISIAGGQIASVFADAIFGPSGPSYVYLSEASLQAIQDRVRIELVDAAEYQYIAELDSLELSIKYYGETASNGTPDSSVLGSLLINSNDLLTHYSLNSSFNDEYYYMADNYALAASLNMAIYVERHAENIINSSAVKARANYLANELQTLLDAKKDADLPLVERCEEKSSPYDQYELIECTVKDPHGNRLARQSFVDSSPNERWDTEVQLTENEYYEKHFGEIEDVISKLRDF